MLDPGSPLYIRPRFDKSFMIWLHRFWRSCNTSAYDAGLDASAEFFRQTPKIMQVWRDEGIEFESHPFGYLVDFRENCCDAHYC